MSGVAFFKPAALVTQASYIMKIPDLNYASKDIIPRLVKLTDALELFLTDADYNQN